jgi:hypothetical protein
MSPWKGEYPWLRPAFQAGYGNNAETASEHWRRRIEEDLETTLDYSGVRNDGTASLWCGQSCVDFATEPTDSELLDGLVRAYRDELTRLGRESPIHPQTSEEGPAETSDAG